MAAGSNRLLVVWHSRAGGTGALVDRLVAGASTPEVDGVEVVVRHAPEAGPDDIRHAAALLVATPERFGAMAGLVKDFFERIYYELLEETRGLPYALVVKASTDGTGAVREVERIATGLAWKPVQPPLLVVGDVTEEHEDDAFELGATVAAGVSMGLY